MCKQFLQLVDHVVVDLFVFVGLQVLRQPIINAEHVVPESWNHVKLL